MTIGVTLRCLNDVMRNESITKRVAEFLVKVDLFKNKFCFYEYKEGLRIFSLGNPDQCDVSRH